MNANNDGCDAKNARCDAKNVQLIAENARCDAKNVQLIAENDGSIMRWLRSHPGAGGSSSGSAVGTTSNLSVRNVPEIKLSTVSV